MVRESPGPRASLRSSRPLLGSVFWTAWGAGRPRDPAVSGFRPYCRTWQPRTVGLQASRLHALACLGERAAREAGDGGVVLAVRSQAAASGPFPVSLEE